MQHSENGILSEPVLIIHLNVKHPLIAKIYIKQAPKN